MNTTCIKCRDCGAIMVINTKELWKLQSCTKCESTNLVDLDSEFQNSEIIEENENVEQN